MNFSRPENPDLVLINKKIKSSHLVDSAVPANLIEKLKENEKIFKYLGLTRELKKTVENEGDGDSNCS